MREDTEDNHMIGYINAIVNGVNHSLNWESQMIKDLDKLKKDNEWGTINQTQEGDWEEKFWDDMTGEKLESNLIRIARAEEMAEVKKHNLYTKVPLKQ